MSLTTTRRPKWHPTPPPPPPSPKILNLPRRTRRRQPRKTSGKPPVSCETRKDYRGRLEALFDQERIFSRTVPVVLLEREKRERVEEREDGGGGGGSAEEKWRFQAEILRAECNFLRIEKEFALKKLESNRVQMERTLRSAVQTLVSGRKKIYEGKNVNAVLEEEIGDLEEILGELQRSSGIKDFEVKQCSNFDKKASLLQRRLEKLGEVREIAEASLSINTNNKIDDESFRFGHKSNNKFTDVELLRRKMEGLSKGMLDRMEEEYGFMLPTTANSSATSSASTSKPVEIPDSSSRQPYQEPIVKDEKKCSGRCKSMVWRIVEQVRAETEQWSQMQEMLGQVREEMEELQTSRDFWEDRALDSNYEIQCLHSKVREWKKKALTLETKANDLQTEISVLRGQVDKLTKEKSGEIKKTTKELAPLSLGEQIANEKRVLTCHLKENHDPNNRGSESEMFCDGRRKAQLLVLKRSPFQDIGNSSPKLRQKSKAIFPLQGRERLIERER